MDQVTLIALGANRPSPAGPQEATLRAALTALAASPDITLAATSRFYRSPAFPAGSGPDYINAAARLETALAPAVLLERLHEIEAAHGRTRDKRWGARSLDLDLLAMGEAVLPDHMTWRQWHDLPLDRQAEEAPEQLILPHPRLDQRAFVLVPLSDIAPDWRHPLLGLDVRAMLARLPADETAAVQAL